jgi:lipopolysaccharide transport system ATP-binding protein
MSDIILKAVNISKQYRLGLVGTGTLSHDLNRLWAKIRGKEDPYLQVGAVNDRSASASSDYVWALKEINFEVKRGEILGIIGKNGAGKSTLLKILSRVTSPTTGSIKTGGRIASLLEVGTGMHPELTGRENIFLNGAILGMNKTEISSKIDEIIEFSGCQMYIDTPVKRYSSGMRVRLGFAVAAFLEPDILVVDEVLAVGDAEFQKKAIGKMQDISNTSGRTVIFVSHNMAAVKTLCTRAIVLKNGISTFNGNTNEAVEFYLTPDDNSYNYKEILSNSKYLNGYSFENKNINHGDDLKINLNLNFQKLEALSFGYIIVNEFDERMAGGNTYQGNVTFLKQLGNKAELSIKNINLIPGRYFISFYIGNGSFDLEHLKNAYHFDISWIDNKTLPKKQWGPAHFKTSWKQL